MHLSTLIKIIGSGESDTVEFKSKITKDSAKDIVAFLNTEGGYVVYGVDDDGNIVGVEGGSVDKILDSIEPKPVKKIKVHTFNVENKKIVVVEVKKSNYIHTYRNVVYVRIGTISKPLSIEEVIEKASESLLLRYDILPNPNCEIDELSEKYIDDYLRKREIVRKVKFPDVPFEKKLLLIHAATKHNGDIVPTNAGILFFCGDPQRYIPHAITRCVVFSSESMEESVDTDILAGPLWKQVEDCEIFIKRYVPVSSEMTSREFRRHARRIYPLSAIREAVINAIAHRNYFDYGDVRLFIFPKRIEVINPGSFPPGVTPENPIHKPRNPIISQYFYDLGYVEKYGIGIERMRRACREYGVEGPIFHIREYETKVVFRLGEEREEDAILREAQRKGYITSRDVMNILNVSRDTANRYLKKLIEAGKLRKMGKGKNTRYIPI